MLVFLFLILPAIAAMFFFFQHAFLAGKTGTVGVFLTLFLLLSLFLIADSLYAFPDIGDRALSFSRFIELAVAPCLVPLLWMYLHKLISDSRFVPLQYLWLLLPLFTLTIGVLLHFLAGDDLVPAFVTDLYENGPSAAFKHRGDAIFIYYVFTVIIFRALIGLELLACFAYMLWYMVKEKMSLRDLGQFYSKGAGCRVLELQMFNLILPAMLVLVKTVLPTSFLREHVWVGLLLSALIIISMSVFAFTALFGARKSVSLANMRQVMVYNYNSDNKAGIVAFTQEDLLEEADESGLRHLRDKISERLPSEPVQESATGAISEQLFATMAGTWDEESLLSRFQSLLTKDKIFLQPGISLVEIADKLHTNKTYVSKLVNQTYNMAFPELLNTLRIDYAQQYILNHRKAKQSEIAEACGFLSASTFNSIFKKVTGVTPKMWMGSVSK